MEEKTGKRKKVGPSSICLPVEFAALNLIEEVRADAITRFERHGIEWHMWTPSPDTEAPSPTTHLLSSQVQAVNVLLSLAQAPELLLNLLKQVVPDAVEVVAVEDGSPVAFEWIGLDNYLGERTRGPRKRGKFTTSADALFVVKRTGGGYTGILVEWKFTEDGQKIIRFKDPGPGHTDRRDIYRVTYEALDTPFADRPRIEAYFQEGHYQLLRLALLAHKMVEAAEHRIDRAVVLHLVPAGNRAFRNTVPDGLRGYGDEVAQVWEKLLPGPVVSYRCMDTTPLFRATPVLAERYGSLP